MSSLLERRVDSTEASLLRIAELNHDKLLIRMRYRNEKYHFEKSRFQHDHIICLVTSIGKLTVAKCWGLSVSGIARWASPGLACMVIFGGSEDRSRGHVIWPTSTMDHIRCLDLHNHITLTSALQQGRSNKHQGLKCLSKKIKIIKNWYPLWGR